VYVDSFAAQEFCRQIYGREFPVISYGADVREGVGSDLLAEYGVEAGRYLLFVGRLIPEKGVHLLVEAYRKVGTDMPLVIVGDNPYHPDYVAALHAAADERVRLVGPVFGDAFWQLTSNCHIYVQPSEVEGTSPMLLTAMGQGRCVVVNGIDENLDVIGDAGVGFHRNDAADLAWVIGELLRRPQVVEELGAAAKARVREHYDWDVVADLHEQLFLSIS
jgi:glycosyltransferase involved in cell wall biosynthesis